MAIRTIYEIAKPDQQFYSVERVGYTTVGDAAASIGTDLVQLGAFTVKNISFEVDVGGTITNSYSTNWPPVARQWTLSSPGAGYKVGDKLQAVGGTGSPKFQISVTAIKSAIINGVTYDGAIDTFTVTNIGSYTVPPGPAVDLALEYTDPNYVVADVTVNGNLTLADGSGIVPPAVDGVTNQGSNTAVWNGRWGSNGSGGTSGKRWPEGAWVFTSIFSSDIKVGAKVTLAAGADASSSIPPGTVITGTYIASVVDGLYNARQSWQTPAFYERSSPATFITFSNPVTIKNGDKLKFTGNLATFDNTVIKTPEQWTAIFEAAGAIDPLNDTVGVFGNIAVSASNSNQLQITNIQTTNTYNPVIYEGQTISSLPDEPNPVPPRVTVVSVDNYYETVGGVKIFKANVVLSSNISIVSNKTVRFRFASPQPWRLALQVQKNVPRPAAGSQILNVYAATDLQLTDDVTISKVYDSTGVHVDWAGLMGDRWTAPASGKPDTNNVSQGFYNREKRVSASPENYPLNYSLTITNRGVFVGMWEGNWSTMQKSAVSINNDNFFNWFLIQRAVNRSTGKIVTTGRCPVFCINGVGYKYWKFIVREEDVMHPTVGPNDSAYRRYDPVTKTITTVSTPYRTPADYHTIDNFALLNTTNQISLTEDSKYLVSFINNLTTPRFRYSDELDMIGQTSADVVGQGVELAINAYGQSLPRYYRALPANNKFNTGLRICVLKDIPPA